MDLLILKYIFTFHVFINILYINKKLKLKFLLCLADWVLPQKWSPDNLLCGSFLILPSAKPQLVFNNKFKPKGFNELIIQPLYINI